MNWRRELQQLRETLTRDHAIEAFHHFRERPPASDGELEQFIDWYVKHAYDEGIEDWNSQAETVTRRPQESTIGTRLKSAGYDDVWCFFDAHGVSIESFRDVVQLPNLAPVGFDSFVVETALHDGRWDLAFRALICSALNSARESSTIVRVGAVARVGNSAPKDIAWIKVSCDKLARHIARNEFDLNREFNWNDDWMNAYLPPRRFA